MRLPNMEKPEKQFQKPVILGLLTLILLIGGYAYWRYLQTHISTDNAYVNAHSIQIATQVSGPVLTLFVDNNRTVNQGDPLFDIDPAPFEHALHKAEAQILHDQAHLKNAQTNLDRVAKLVDKKFLSPDEKDNAVTAVSVAAANLKLAEASLAQAKLDLEHTHITAPASGIINNMILRPGTMVQAQVPLFVLISNQQFWIDANFKETELKNIKPSQMVSIVLDMYPSQIFHGVIDSISHSSGTAYSLLPPQNATGNWVKVTQRIPVKIMVIDPNPEFPLRVGATASVTVLTHQTPKT